SAESRSRLAITSPTRLCSSPSSSSRRIRDSGDSPSDGAPQNSSSSRSRLSATRSMVSARPPARVPRSVPEADPAEQDTGAVDQRGQRGRQEEPGPQDGRYIGHAAQFRGIRAGGPYGGAQHLYDAADQQEPDPGVGDHGRGVTG